MRCRHSNFRVLPRMACLPRLAAAVLLAGLLPAPSSAAPAADTVIATTANPADTAAAVQADAPAPSLAAQFAAATFPGACMAAVRDGRVVLQQAFGYADVASRRPYTLQTVQPVGSVSKTVIGVALMKALELGLLGPQGLDTPINALLDQPVQHPQHPHDARWAITLRQLATHTSGIVDGAAAYADAYRFGRTTPAESLQAYLHSVLHPGGRRYSRRHFADTPPGASFHYSNVGSALAARAIEVRAGMPFDAFATRHVLQPLGMDDSGWWARSALQDRSATLYDPDRRPIPPYVLATYPDGALRTSCTDLLRYLQALLQGASGDGPQASALLGAADFAELLRPQFPPPGAAGRPAGVSTREPNQGLFFTLRRDGSIGHTGSDYGASAFLFFDPATRSGRLFMSNVDIGAEPALQRAFSGMWKTLGDF